MLRISNLIGGVSGIRVIDLCSTPCLSYDRGRGREQEGDLPNNRKGKQVNHLSTTYFRLEIREFDDQESASGKAWLVDLLDQDNNLIGEAIGEAPTLMQAMQEAGKEITLFVADQWLVSRAELGAN